MYAALWIWFIEVSLIYIILKTIVFDKDHFVIQTPSVDVYMTRFACSMLMHMELIEDLKQGLSLMEYLYVHPEEFKSACNPFIYALC